MAQAGYTPVQLYYSTTPTQAPLAANLSQGELAINIYDGKLYYKNSTNVTTLLADQNTVNASVSSVSVVSANGFAGTVATATTTPAITISTSITGLLKGNGTAVSAAVSSTDYAPATSGTSILYGNGTGGFSSVTIGSGLTFAAGTLANAVANPVGTTNTQTLTNKRIDPRVTSAASASTLTPDVSAADIYAYTALAAGLTINAPTGTPVDGDKLAFRILDNGTSRTLTWNATYTVIGTVLPPSTTPNKTVYVGCVYNANNTRWDVVAVTTQV
jgi:hypothetical protein